LRIDINCAALNLPVAGYHSVAQVFFACDAHLVVGVGDEGFQLIDRTVIKQ
jgi:hypothetical protein